MFDRQRNAQKGGTRPLRACGTRFVAHKVVALTRLIDMEPTLII